MLAMACLPCVATPIDGCSKLPAHSSPLCSIRRDVLERIGYLDESIVAFQEWDTAIRLSQVAEFGFVPEPTFDYDERTPVAISRDAQRAARGYEQIVRKHRQAIVSQLGPRGLAGHYRVMAGLRRQAEMKGAHSHVALVSIALWPPNGVRALGRRFRRLRR